MPCQVTMTSLCHTNVIVHRGMHSAPHVTGLSHGLWATADKTDKLGHFTLRPEGDTGHQLGNVGFCVATTSGHAESHFHVNTSAAIRLGASSTMPGVAVGSSLAQN